MLKQKKVRTVSCGLLLLLLTGCTASWRYPQPSAMSTAQGAAVGATGGALIGTVTGNPITGAVLGGISGGALATYFAAQASLAEKIAANHVQIILIGDTLKLVLPAQRFFAPATPVLNENYYSVLNQLATLLKNLNNYAIKIVGYSDSAAPQAYNLALTRQRAQALANYLWSRGIDSRLLYATGYGAEAPIATNLTAAGRALNNRLEITVREITDGREQ